MKKRSVLLATFLGLSMCLGMGTQNEGHRVYVKADEVVSGGAVGTEYAYIIGDVLVNYVNEQAAVTNDDMIMSYTVPDSIRRIGDYAFSGYQGLDEVIMSNSVQEIGCSAFSSCYSLERVKLSENLTTIGREAFQGCERLTELVLPSTLTEIGPGAFPATCKLIVTQGSYAETYVKENRYAYQYTTGETFEGSVDAGRIDETPIPIITLAPTQEPEETVNPQTTLDPQTTLNPQTTLDPQTTVTPGENGGKVVAPGKVTLKSVKKASKTKIKVTFKTVGGAKGYQIVYAQNKNFKNAKKVEVKGTTKTISKLKKGKTYYVKVRAFKKIKGKYVYGKYSAVKKIVLK